MAEEMIEIGSLLPDLLERRDRGFRFSPARTGAASHRRAGAAPISRTARRVPIRDRACENRGQRLDRDERSDSERRDDRRKFGRCGGVGRFEKRGAEHGRCRKSGGGGETVSKHEIFQRPTSTFNAQRSIQALRSLDVGRRMLGVFFLMKRKRIVVMGFMGSIPIAGVIWQHIHYIVGLQRLGHDVYYIEDSARLPYNPETFERQQLI